MRLDKPLRNKVLYGYGIGNLGYGMVLQAISTYLLYFCNVLLHIPGTIIGVIISISVIWDALSDPIMGTISDYTSSKRFGRRHLYILIGGIGTSIFNVLLWSVNAEWSLQVKVILIVIFIFGLKTLSTVFVTPYMALGGELTEDYYKRTKIQSIRTVCFVLGLGFTVVAGMIFFLRATEQFPEGQNNIKGYMYLAIATSIFMLLSTFVTYFSTKKYIPKLNEDIHDDFKQKREGKILKNLKEDLVVLGQNTNYLYIALAYLSANLATAIIGSIGLHVFTYTFRIQSANIGIILGALFVTNVFSQPFWLYYSRKHDKKNAAILATTIGLVAIVLFGFCVAAKSVIVTTPFLLIPFSMIAGFGVGGLLTLPLSMVGDTIDVEEAHTGRRSEGLYYGGLTFSYKASQAIAIAVLGVLLDLSGFNSELSIQSGTTETLLGVILAVGCLLAFSLTLYAYKRYNLSHDDILAIQNKLEGDL